MSELTVQGQQALLTETRGRIGVSFISKLATVFEEVGEEAIRMVAEEKPDKFLEIVAKQSPPVQQVEHTASGTLAEYLQDRAQGAYLDVTPEEPDEGTTEELPEGWESILA